jgi:hypothetical protein
MKLSHNHKLHGDAINKTEKQNKKYGIVGTMAKYCRNTPNTHIHNQSLVSLGPCSSIKKMAMSGYFQDAVMQVFSNV